MTGSAAFYVTGGTLAPDARSYLPRAADAELLDTLVAGELCYILNARQMGKSSLCLRTRQALTARGIRTVFLDLQKFGSSATPEQWFNSLLQRIGLDLKLRAEMLTYWRENAERAPLDRLFGAITDVALASDESPLVIFLDEVDVVRSLPFATDELFGAIRESYNERATNAERRRLTFCLVGSALQADLVADTRLSPFNVGRQLDLQDFTLEELAPLAPSLGDGGAVVLSRIYHWTGGHPFLTQSVCAAVLASGASESKAVDAVVKDMFLTRTARQDVVHLADVSNRILSRKAGEIEPADDRQKSDILALYEQIWRGKKPVLDDARRPHVGLLKLSGIVRADSGVLRVRNRIYERVFDAAWIAENRPNAEVRRQRTAVSRARWQIGSLAASVLLVMAGLLWRTTRAESEARKEAKLANHLAYISAINDIARNIDTLSYDAAEKLFDAAASFPVSERSYEWNYLTERLNPELLALKGASEDFHAVSISPDGKRIVTGTLSNATARVWDSETGRPLFTLTENAKGIAYIRFSPDGTKILTGLVGGGATIWNTSTGRKLVRLSQDGASIISASFTADGRRIVTGSSDGHAERVWDASSGKVITSIDPYPSGDTFVSFAPGGEEFVAANSMTGSTALWDASTGKKLRALKDLEADFVSAAFSRDGKWIATATNGGAVTIASTESGEETRKLIGHEGPVMAVAFSDDGQKIVTAGRDHTVRVWAASNGKQLRQLAGHGDEIRSVCFSGDASRIVSGSRDGTARVWDAAFDRTYVSLGGPPVASRILASASLATGFSFESRGLSDVAFSRDGADLLMGRFGGSVEVYDSATGRRLDSVYSSQIPMNTDILFSPDCAQFATNPWGAGGNSALWDIKSRKRLLPITGSTLCFFPNGKRIVAASTLTSAACVLDTSSGKVIFRLNGGNAVKVLCAAVSPDALRILTCYDDGSGKIWDATTGRELISLILAKDHDAIKHVTFSPGGRLFASIKNGSESVQIWDSTSGKRLAVLDGHEAMVVALSFSPDGKRIATAGWDGTARLWDVETGRELLTLRGHLANPDSVAFSPDSSRLATGSFDHTAIIWRRMNEDQVAAMHLEREAALRQQERLAALSQKPLSFITRFAKEYLAQYPEQRVDVAAKLNDRCWAIVDPAKPRPTQEQARSAEQVAEEAVGLTESKDGLILDTLAAARFACGDLGGALETERKAVRLRPADKDLASALARYETLAAGASKEPKPAKAVK